MDRFRADFKRLLQEGGQLQLALNGEVYGKKELLKLVPEGSDQSIFEELPSFKQNYNAWYSESTALIQQLLPERLADFKGHYEVPKSRKEITFESYRIFDALNGLRVTRQPYNEVVVDDRAALGHLTQQIAILNGIERRFESSLFEIRQLVQADFFDSEIETAKELLKKKFVRAAGAISGVVLEKHLSQVCRDHKLKIVKKNPGINDLNQLLRDNDVIDVPQWRNITFLADIRNLCDHNKGAEPTVEQVSDLIQGVAKLIKTLA